MSVSNFMSKLFTRSSMPRVPLNVAFNPKPSDFPATKAPTSGVQVTTLPNGIKVVTQETNVPVNSVGVLVDVSSKYEPSELTGITHFIERMALKSTTNRSAFRLVREMGQLGINLSVTNSLRDSLLYTADTTSESLDHAVAALADVITNPAFKDSEVAEELEWIKFDGEVTPSVVIDNAINSVAFKGSLGNPLYPTPTTINNFSPDVLKQWHNTFFTPKRLTIAAVGPNHEKFVNLVQSLFVNLPVDQQIPEVPVKYVGGEVRIMDRNGPSDGLTHVALGFEGSGFNSPSVIANSVLQTAMGGGGSFTEGGPGKGMYSRLYQNVLNRHNWIESVMSFNIISKSTGFYGIYGVCEPSQAGQLVDVISNELVSVAKNGLSEEEVTRAKNQLKSSIFSYWDSRANLLEDMVRQVHFTGKFDELNIKSSLDKVTSADIQKVAANLLKSPLSLATYGDASEVPRYDVIAKKFN